MCVRAVEKRTNQGKDVTITTLMYTVARRKMDKMVEKMAKNGLNGQKMAEMAKKWPKWPKWWEIDQNGGNMTKMVGK